MSGKRPMSQHRPSISQVQQPNIGAPSPLRMQQLPTPPSADQRMLSNNTGIAIDRPNEVQTPSGTQNIMTAPTPPVPAMPTADSLPPRPPAITRLSTDQVPSSPSPVRRMGTGGNEMTYWTPPAPRYQPSYQDMNYSEAPHAIPTTEHVYDEHSQMMSGGVPQNQPYQRWPTHKQSSSMRGLRFDPKRNSYRFDALSDIDSVNGSPSRSAVPRMRAQGGGGGDSVPPDEILRLPLTWWMNSSAKNHFVALLGEFIGTTMFLFFAFAGTQVANIDQNGSTATNNGYSPIVLLYISSAFGFSLMVNVWIFFRISGGLFNPAVTLGMYLVRSISMFRALLLLIAQLCGSMLATVLLRALFPTSLSVRTTLSEDTSLARGVFIEAVLTAELVFTIFMLAKEKHKATFMAPIGIGFSLFISELVGVYYTGGSLNPARSFGPCLVTGVWDKEHWIYWLGPAMGAILAVCFYKLIKILEYEVANPGQDAKNEEETTRPALPRHRKTSSEA